MTNVFENNSNEDPNKGANENIQQTTQDTDPYGVLLTNIKSVDGKQKYATVSDALNSIAPKEQHIAALEAENAILREKAEKGQTVDDILAALSNKGEESQAPDQGVDSSTQQQQEQENQSMTQSGLTVEQLDAFLEMREQKKNANRNIEQFNQKLAAQFGDKAKDAFEQAAKATGMGVDFVRETAAKNPDFALQMLGLKEQPEELSLSSVYKNAGTTPTVELTNLEGLEGQARYEAIRNDTLKRLRKQGDI